MGNRSSAIHNSLGQGGRDYRFANGVTFRTRVMTSPVFMLSLLSRFVRAAEQEMSVNKNADLLPNRTGVMSTSLRDEFPLEL